MDLAKNQREKGILTDSNFCEAIACIFAGDRLKIDGKSEMKKDGIKIEKGLDKADKIVYNK